MMEILLKTSVTSWEYKYSIYAVNFPVLSRQDKWTFQDFPINSRKLYLSNLHQMQQRNEQNRKNLFKKADNVRAKDIGDWRAG